MIAQNTAGRENGKRRPKGYVSWQPTAQKVQVRLEQAESVLEEYADYLPLTLRQIFYRMVGSFGYEKTDNGYNRLCETLVLARRSQRIPFSAIRDDGVVTFSDDWHSGVVDFWNDTGRRIHRYRRDRQVGQAVRVELWCESAGMAPQLARVGDEYSIPVYSAGGFGSLTAVRQVVDRAVTRDVPTVLLHVGDLDPSGESIFSSFVEDVAAFMRDDRVIATQRVDAVRVALTPAQVVEYELPTSPAKVSDSRSASWEGGTAQLEALAPDDLARIVDGAIRSCLDAGVLERQMELERQDVGELWRGLPKGAS